MEVFTSIESFCSSGQVVVFAAGVFDGVHRGHQKVLQAMRELAEELKATPAVLSFYPHPAKILSPKNAPQAICTRLQKRALLAEYGVEVLLEIPFDKNFAATPWQEFLRQLFAGGSVLGICAGDSWSFGADRGGNMEILRAEGVRCGFSVRQVAPVVLAGSIVSSTRVRRAIRERKIEEAECLLGHPYVVCGRVQKGAQLGRQLGFPTANLAIEEQILPDDGVYAVQARHGEEWYPGVANLGMRPTIASADPGELRRSLEVHLFDFREDLYEQELAVRFVAFLRLEKKFSTLEALRLQIAADSTTARQILAAKEPPQ